MTSVCAALSTHIIAQDLPLAENIKMKWIGDEMCILAVERGKEAVRLRPGRENWLVGQDIVIRLEEPWEGAGEHVTSRRAAKSPGAVKGVSGSCRAGAPWAHWVTQACGVRQPLLGHDLGGKLCNPVNVSLEEFRPI